MLSMKVLRKTKKVYIMGRCRSVEVADKMVNMFYVKEIHCKLSVAPHMWVWRNLCFHVESSREY